MDPPEIGCMSVEKMERLACCPNKASHLGSSNSDMFMLRARRSTLLACHEITHSIEGQIVFRPLDPRGGNVFSFSNAQSAFIRIYVLIPCCKHSGRSRSLSCACLPRHRCLTGIYEDLCLNYMH